MSCIVLSGLPNFFLKLACLISCKYPTIFLKIAVILFTNEHFPSLIAAASSGVLWA